MVFLNRQSFTFLRKVHFVLEFCKISPRKGTDIQKPKALLSSSTWRSYYYCSMLALQCLSLPESNFFRQPGHMGSPWVSKMTSKHFVEAGSTQCSRHLKTNEPKTIRDSTRASSFLKKHHQNPAFHLLGYSACYTPIPSKAWEFTFLLYLSNSL